MVEEPQTALEAWERGRKIRERLQSVHGIERFGIILGFLGFLFSLALLGNIIRGHSSPYVWNEWPDHLRKFGLRDSILIAIWYFLLYGYGILIPYLLLDRLSLRSNRWLLKFGCASWVLLTCLVFADSIIAFLRNLPTQLLNGWLIIGWGGATFWAVRTFLQLRHLANIEPLRHNGKSGGFEG